MELLPMKVQQGHNVSQISIFVKYFRPVGVSGIAEMTSWSPTKNHDLLPFDVVGNN